LLRGGKRKSKAQIHQMDTPKCPDRTEEPIEPGTGTAIFWNGSKALSICCAICLPLTQACPVPQQFGPPITRQLRENFDLRVGCWFLGCTWHVTRSPGTMRVRSISPSAGRISGGLYIACGGFQRLGYVGEMVKYCAFPPLGFSTDGMPIHPSQE
jgi:hypothetical protein